MFYNVRTIEKLAKNVRVQIWKLPKLSRALKFVVILATQICTHMRFLAKQTL